MGCNCCSGFRWERGCRATRPCDAVGQDQETCFAESSKYSSSLEYVTVCTICSSKLLCVAALKSLVRATNQSSKKGGGHTSPAGFCFSMLLWKKIVEKTCLFNDLFSMASWKSSQEPQKTQMNTALYTGHTNNRAPAGHAPLLGSHVLGGHASSGLAENPTVLSLASSC